MTLHERIREQREIRGLSQEQLAEGCGLSRTQVSNIERGLHTPGIRNLQAIARALGTTVTALLGETALPATGTEA